VTSSNGLTRITGEIWFDRNKDGVDNAPGDNLAYATVKLLDSDFNVIETTQTDVHGHYGFESLQPGTYHVDFGPHHDYTAKDVGSWCKGYKDDSDVTLGLTDAIVLKPGDAQPYVDAGIFTAGDLDFDRSSPVNDDVVNGTDTNDVMDLGYIDAQGDEITNQNDVIVGGAGDDVINGAGGDDIIVGDNAGNNTQTGPVEVGVDAEAGQYNLLVWDLADLNIAGVRDNPFQDGDVTGEPTRDIAGGSLGIQSGATPVTVGVNDNDGRFNDGDWNPEYAYTIREADSGDVITIYAVELGANKMVGIISDQPLEVGGNYEFIARVDTHPSVDYSDLADTYIVEGGSNQQPTSDGSDAGDDTIYGGAGDDVIYGDNGDVNTETASTEAGIDAEAGQYNLLVWDLADLNIAGVRDNPFQDGDVTGEPTRDIAGGSLGIQAGATPVTVGVNDNDGRFNDGDGRICLYDSRS